MSFNENSKLAYSFRYYTVSGSLFAYSSKYSHHATVLTSYDRLYYTLRTIRTRVRFNIKIL